MSTSTVGVELDDETRGRLKHVVDELERTPHWVIKTALKERHEDKTRWARYQESGQAIAQKQVMQWLDALAAGHEVPCPR